MKVFALILYIAYPDGVLESYALRTELTLSECQAALLDFPMDGMRGELKCRGVFPRN